MYGHRYDVPIVLTDCSPAEALSQAFDNLSHLDDVLKNMFARITERINHSKSLIQALDNRIAIAQQKVTLISNHPNRVITVFSAAKYPAAKILPDYEQMLTLEQSATHIGSHIDDRMIADIYPLTDKQQTFPMTARKIHKMKRHDRYTAAQPTDTSQLFTILSKARLTRTEHVTDEAAEGLGRLPSYLPSISSILLFNSDENPYKQYVTINNLEGTAGQDRQHAAVGPSAAPKSIIEGADLPTFSAYQFDYKPLLGELPSFNLPANLPLGMIADIQFGEAAAAHLSIAPSASAITGLPSLAQLSSLSPIPQTSNVSTIPNNVSISSLPPPPANSAVPPVSNIPAPPPMAPPMAPPMISSDAPPPPPPPDAPSASSATASAPSKGDARSSLLDAIRNRDKIKLKKAKKRDEDDDTAGGGKAGAAGAAKKKVDSGGGDMMEALKARLARRQQALSGKTDETKTASSSASSSSSEDRPKLPAKLLPKLTKGDEGDSIAIPANNNEDNDRDDNNGSIASKQKGLNESSVMKAILQAHSKKTEDEDQEWN